MFLLFHQQGYLSIVCANYICICARLSGTQFAIKVCLRKCIPV